MPLGRVQNITGLQISPLAGNSAHWVFDESLKRPHYCVLKIQVLYLAACNKKNKPAFLTPFSVFPLIFPGITEWRVCLKLCDQCIYVDLNLPYLSLLMQVSDACINTEHCLVSSTKSCL